MCIFDSAIHCQFLQLTIRGQLSSRRQPHFLQPSGAEERGGNLIQISTREVGSLLFYQGGGLCTFTSRPPVTP